MLVNRHQTLDSAKLAIPQKCFQCIWRQTQQNLFLIDYCVVWVCKITRILMKLRIKFADSKSEAVAPADILIPTCRLASPFICFTIADLENAVDLFLQVSHQNSGMLF